MLMFATGCGNAIRTQPDPATRQAATPAPAHRWRGIMLDVARYYVTPSTLRRLIDLLAHEQLNVLHLHLTDDEAWRLPSRRYPRLASTLHYTRAQLRDLAAYAAARGVMIVPEIDVPAHTASVIRAYPDLGCGQPDELCPGTASRFGTDVVKDVVELFRGPYVHTGGDEVMHWSTRERARFERALDAAVSRSGRTMVVWDDEADAAPPNAIVEAWHLRPAQQARVSGHRTIDASDGPFYFDAVQGAAMQEPPGTRYVSTLEQVYAAHPPDGVFGVEATMWTQHIRDNQTLWYMLLPRALALAQVASLPATRKSWAQFRSRVLPRELAWLHAHGYPFRVPATEILLHDPQARYGSVRGNADAAIGYTSSSHIPIELRSAVPGAQEFYRLNGSHGWTRYTGGITAASGTLVSAKNVAPGGASSVITSLYITRASHPRGSARFDDVVSP